LIFVNKFDSLGAALQLIVDRNLSNVGLLNFRSGDGPGGGFLRSVTSQEGNLCRHSGLYPIIKNQKLCWDYHKQVYGYFSDSILYSPEVPFCFDHDGQPYQFYFKCGVITSAACKLTDVQQEQDKREKSNQFMLARVRKIIKCAIVNQVIYLILGAFGCGACGNDDEDIVKLFHQILIQEQMRFYFDEIYFPIYTKDLQKLGL
jgi:uncharacterized protein (TIGR02452 family)